MISKIIKGTSFKNCLTYVLGKSGSPEVVANVDAVPEEKEKLKRLTLDIPNKLHRAIKGKAALEGKAMVDMLRELLEEKYGTL